MSIKADSERRFWIGVCAEMAHQMGTPLSALMGWLDILPSLQDQTAARIEMNRNLERLQLISERLGQIGVPAGFEPVPLKDILTPLCNYAAKRMPGGEGAQRMQLEIRGNPVAQANPVLLPWALENLVKSAIDAVHDASGRIVLRAYRRKERVFIEIEVNGGWDLSQPAEKVQFPSIVTKPDYRAAGLAVGRYIIHAIHGGRLAVKKYPDTQKAAFVVSLNSAHLP
jgi:signal transduction histidine kinase